MFNVVSKFLNMISMAFEQPVPEFYMSIWQNNIQFSCIRVPTSGISKTTLQQNQ